MAKLSLSVGGGKTSRRGDRLRKEWKYLTYFSTRRKLGPAEKSSGREKGLSQGQVLNKHRNWPYRINFVREKSKLHW